ncbi:hypothetical protein TZ03_12750 [Pseudomonas sp. 10-1B]|nr:hypothetical protein TZ03_12750 [Pseudomonas sp. 10-1B]
MGLLIIKLGQLPWSFSLIILGQCKRPEEREFYLRMAVRQAWEAPAAMNRHLVSRCLLGSEFGFEGYNIIDGR